MRVVAALGGNALLRRDQSVDVDVQRGNIAVAVKALAELAVEHQLVVTHGNAPQVGLLALQAHAYKGVRPYPLDVLGAESEGMIGYLLEQGLANALPERRTATLLTQVIVDRDDPAFGAPTKPVGPTYARDRAERMARERGWTIARDGSGWRRVVASPEPRDILELDAVRILVEAEVIVTCVGGGGVPVVRDEHGLLRGVEAVIDKDRSAALLARELDADALLLLTDVPGIERAHGTPTAHALATVSVAELGELDLPEGSMRPKAEAAARFTRETGGLAAIGALQDASALLCGRAGTRVIPERLACAAGSSAETAH